MVDDLSKGTHVSAISYRFHITLIRLFADLCKAIRSDTGCPRVVLSGGVFQNAVLLSGLTKTLLENGFKIYSHSKIPTNDGGISFGQAAIAAAVYKKTGVSYVLGCSHEGTEN